MYSSGGNTPGVPGIEIVVMDSDGSAHEGIVENTHRKMADVGDWAEFFPSVMCSWVILIAT